MDASQKPDPAGRPHLLPWPFTAINSSPLPVAPFWHWKVPEELLNRTLSCPSHTRLVCSALPLPSTSSCSAHESELAGVVAVTLCPMLLAFVALDGGGILAFCCTLEGLTCSPADVDGAD